MKLLCIFALITMVTEVMSQALTREKEQFLISCLKHRHRGFSTASGIIQSAEETADCLNFLESARRISIESLSPNLPKRKGPFLYMSSVIPWRNGRKELREALLDDVSPCWKQEPLLRAQWERQFNRQKGAFMRWPKTTSNVWNTYVGNVTFRRMMPSYPSDSMIAAEIILAKRSPAEIEEHYGRYKSKVYVVDSNGQREGSIHSDYQSSCPTNKGKYFVLNLNLARLRRWYDAANDSLQIQVRIDPVRQFIRGRNSGQHVNVVEEILGLVLHFNPSSTDPAKPSLALLLNEDVTSHRSRQRRSAERRQMRKKLRRKSCGLISYKLPESFYKGSLIIDPVYEDDAVDISECAGRCSYPISDRLNTTNHAIAIGRGMAEHAQEDPRLSICCVPNSYRDLWYSKLNEHEEAEMMSHENLIAESCACL